MHALCMEALAGPLRASARPLLGAPRSFFVLTKMCNSPLWHAKPPTCASKSDCYCSELHRCRCSSCKNAM
eukprot:16493-Heterococcus_DN1.PRE.4